MLWAVLIAVTMITGTAPISPAIKRYLNTGKKYWTTKFTLVIVFLRFRGIKGCVAGTVSESPLTVWNQHLLTGRI
jgi:hypothetical protein